MQKSSHITKKILKVILFICKFFFSKIRKFMSKYPRFSTGVIGLVIFMFCLKYVIGFGEVVAQIVALIIILGAFGILKWKKRS